jgi:hypothetical protein
MIFFINNNKNDNKSNRNYGPPSLFGLIILMGLPVITNAINYMYIKPNSIYSKIFYYLGFIETVIGIIYALAYIFYKINKKEN